MAVVDVEVDSKGGMNSTIPMQQYAIDCINNGENIFLTGSGGCGKSWVIDQVTTDNTILCAPTGIAALNIGGETCHRAFGLPIGIPTDADEFMISKTVREKFSAKIDRVIVDEIGMVRADYLDLMDRRLRNIKGVNKPFGGVQVVLVGDFAQVSPIISGRERKHYFEEYATAFAFGAACWRGLKTIELTEVVRQSNKKQIAVLNSIRMDDYRSKAALKMIKKHAKPYENEEGTLHLCCYKADAEIINDYWYSKIDQPIVTYPAKSTGNWTDAEVPVATSLDLKLGTRILLCANDIDGSYVNGERGWVRELGVDYITVEKDDGMFAIIQPFTWSKYKYSKSDDDKLVKEVDAEFSQYPIKLGYAITFHKSQSMTLDDVAIDVGKGCFAHGMLYMGLSRIRDLKRLSFVRPVSDRNIIVDDEVKEFYRWK